MAQGTKTENTAVNRLIEMAHTRSVDTDDALFSTPSPSARKPALPRPFPGRMTVPVDPPAPLPRTRAPQSTQTQLAAAPPAARPSQRPDDVSTLPFDQIDEDLLDSDDVDDDDLPITVAEAAPRVAAAPAALPPLTIGPVTPLAARPSALGAVPGLEEASWFEESVGVDRFDEASLGTHGVTRSSRARTMLWLSAAFAAGLVATAIVAWPGRSSMVPAGPSPAVVVAQPAAVVTAAPAAVPAVEPAVIEPAVVPPVAEPALVAVPTVVEPAIATPVTIGFASEPAGATVLLVDGSTTVTLGVTPLEHALDPSRSHELMFTLAGHKSTLVTVDPSASASVTVDLTSSTATVEAAPAKAATRPAPQVAQVAKVEPKAAPAARPEPKVKAAKAAPAAKTMPAAKAAPRVAKLEPSRPTPVAGKGGGTLMLGAKPPCDIFIDGKATGLRTPQRAIKVAAGSHKVTLVNREHKITESFSIAVKAGAATKVVKDLSKRMK